MSSATMARTPTVIMTIYTTASQLAALYLTSTPSPMLRTPGLYQVRVPTPVAAAIMPLHVGANIKYCPVLDQESDLINSDLSSEGGDFEYKRIQISLP